MICLRIARIRWLLVIVVVCADQFTKWAVRAFVRMPFVVTNWWCIRPIFNAGGTWGLGSGYAAMPQFLIVLTGCILVLLYKRARAGGCRINIGYALVIGGAVSNAIDRLVYCAVFDFIALHYRCYCWPVFNLADVAIVTGVLWLYFWAPANPQD